MSHAVVEQAAEVITRYLGYGASSDQFALALNTLSETLARDYPRLEQRARGEGLEIARRELQSKAG